jgi:hypothetical protein
MYLKKNKQAERSFFISPEGSIPWLLKREITTGTALGKPVVHGDHAMPSQPEGGTLNWTKGWRRPCDIHHVCSA